MIERDSNNITYITGMDFLGSEEGRRFLEQKYRARIEALKSYFGSRFCEIRLLDVGVGYGMFLSALEREGVEQLYGMDPFPKSIEVASQNTSARIAHGDILDDVWPFEKHSFDAITCLDVVEHLENPALFFSKAVDYLGERGILIVTTPNKSLPYMMRSIPLIGLEDKNPTHINVRRPSYWRGLAKESGYEILDEWRGEHLTHIRFLPQALTLLCRILHLDHRKIPLVNAFEQSYCMVLEPSKASRQ